MIEQKERHAVTRIEWGVIASLIISALTLAFTFGVVYADVQRHEIRLTRVEDRTDDMSERLVRIDANVAFLTEQAREQRQRAEALR